MCVLISRWRPNLVLFSYFCFWLWFQLILYLPFVIVWQKGVVFFGCIWYFDQECVSKPVNYAIGFLNWIESILDGVALSSGRSHFGCTLFPYQGLERPDHNICRLDSWSNARNCHIWSLSFRPWRPTSGRLDLECMTCLMNERIRTSGLLQLSSPIYVLERNLIADWTLDGIRTCYWDIRTDAS